MANLRAYCHLDRMQPQFASFFACTARGFLPVEGMSSLFVEGVPGVESNRLTDIALMFNSNHAGIAYWINDCLKLEGPYLMTEEHEVVGKIKQWLNEQVAMGRFGEAPEDEIMSQLRWFYKEN